jgi:hypothetical protein
VYPPKSDGFYVWCNGAPAGLYYENVLVAKKVSRFSLCLDPDQLAGTGETGGIDLNSWTNDLDDIDTLRSMCVQHCLNVSNDFLGNCLQSPGVQW